MISGILDESRITVQTTTQPAALLSPLDPNKTGHVQFGEVILMALDSLRANKTRSLLTMLGVIIGVASVVALLALGGGASTAITSQVASIGTNSLTIQPGTAETQRPGTSGQVQSLTLADAEALADLHLPVSGVAPMYNGSAQLVAPAADQQALLVGTWPTYQAINNLTVASGAFFDQSHVRSASAVVVLGATLKTDLFGSGEAVGETVRIKGKPLRVIGVLAAKGGSAFGSVDDRAMVPISMAQQQLFGGRTPDGNNWLVSNISLSVIDASDIDAVQFRVETTLRDRHDLTADGSDDDFLVINQAELLSSLSSITNYLTIFLSSVAGISLLVGGIGIMNIMLVSVTERTREIGLRKAVGARGRDILLQFVAEALMLSLTGGMIGLAVGASIAFVVTLSGLLTATVSVSSMVLSVSFSLAVGLFFGIYPARRAARLNPIDALRTD